MNLDSEFVELIIKTLKERTNIKFIYLFGSAVKGNFTSKSDVDIAFYSEDELTDYDVFIVGQKLADSIGKEVDLIDIKKATTVLKSQIVGNGEVIYNRDENLLADFIIRSFKEYALLNEERKEIIDCVRERGKIYE